MSRRGRCCAMQIPNARSLRAADEHLTEEQGRLLAHIFQARASPNSSHDVRQYPELREAAYRGGGDPDMSNLRNR